jgi:hypothetical protein
MMEAVSRGLTTREDRAMADLECLRQLRRVVEAAPEGRFDMSTLCDRGPCGTVHCAAGWAAVDPWFRENTELGRSFAVDRDGMFRYRGRPAEVLERAFGLDEGDVERLFFDADDDTTRADVLASIDHLFAGRPAPTYPEAGAT